MREGMTAIVRKERPHAGSYASGDRTRAKIITSAIEVFAEFGYDGASTRMIASRAEVNLGSIQYYFGSKTQLYLACANHITDSVARQIDALVAALAPWMPSEDATREACIETLSRVLGLAAERIVGDDQNSSWLMFVSREQLSPGPAFIIFYEKVIKRMIGLFSDLVGRIIDRPADSEEAILATVVLLGPLAIFQRANSVVLHALAWPAVDAERVGQIKAILVHQVLHGLTGRPDASAS